MRADMERHKPPRSALDVKLGPGGLVDLEFAIHVLQLTTGVGLDHAARRGARGARRGIFRSGKYCRCAKVAFPNAGHDAPGRSGATSSRLAETWQLVAEACGAASWDELLAEHDAARQSIAELWNRIKGEA